MQFLKLFLVCVLLVSCSTVNQNSRDNNIVKASTDYRSYRYIELPNQLKVLLVSDPAADTAAAAMDVFVGSINEPDGQQGLAHFLEHMLFLGTEKYPQADAYQTFISQNGGGHNAYTSFRHTNYFFDISPQYFAEGLDRFAQFFIAPLFNEDYVHREKQAVNSEYLARIKNDGRKQLDALRQVINPAHPASRFSVGSLDTLKDTNQQSLRESLVRFFNQYYSASNMALVIVAPQSLDESERQVRQNFADVPSFEVPKKAPQASIFDRAKLPLLLEVEPEEVMRKLILMFPIADDELQYRVKPVSYIANLLGHEGEGSLLAALKSCGWAEHLSAGKGLADGSKASLQVSVGLTQPGLDNWPSVIGLTFDYIKLLEKQGVARWRFAEQGSLASMQFNFKGNRRPIEEVSHLANSLHRYPAKNILQGPFLMDAYSQGEIQKILDQLVPENLLLMKVSPGIEASERSPFYDTPYAQQALNVKNLLVEPVPDCASPLTMPAANPYVPEDFALVNSSDESAIKPSQIIQPNLPGVDIWYAPDRQFKTPKAQLFGKLLTPWVEGVKGAAIRSLYLAVVQENLNKQTYPAFLAGLGYSVNSTQQGIEFRVSGFSDKLPLLGQWLIDELTNPEFKQQTVVRLKQSLQEGWRNSQKDEPYRQVFAQIPRQVKSNTYHPLRLADALESVSTKELRQFQQQIIANKKALRLFFNGNFTQAEVEAISAKIGQQLQVEPVKAWPPRSVKKIESWESQTLIVQHNDSAVVRYYQAADDSYKSAAEFMLLRQIIAAPFFDQLRTEQQLGYIVAAVDLTMDKLPGFGLLVQSPTATEREIEQAMDSFLVGFESDLKTLSDEQFEQYRQGVINSLQEKPSNLSEQALRFWGSIDLGYLTFDAREKITHQVQNISPEQLAAVLQEQLLSNPKGLTVATD